MVDSEEIADDPMFWMAVADSQPSGWLSDPGMAFKFAVLIL